MGTADNAMGGSYGAREFSPGEWTSARWRRGSRWTAFEIIAMVLGFIVFWPIGLAILGYKFWQSRNGGPDLQTLATNKWQDARTMMSSNSTWGSSWGCGRAMRGASRFYTPSTGNAAFDEWRTAELARLDEERRKLDDAQREFAEYVDAIRRAKDREEFERFMAERRARPANGGSEAALSVSRSLCPSDGSDPFSPRGRRDFACLTISSCTMVCSGVSFFRAPEPSMRRTFLLLASVGVALMASAGLASAKDSVTIGMVLEPPGLDPTTGAGRRDRRSDALQHLRGPDQDQRGLLGHAAARREMGLLARSQDPDLHPEAERQVPGRRVLLVQGRQVLVRALRRQGLDQQGQGFLRLDRIDRHARSDDGRAQVQGRRASRRCFISA